MKKIVLTIALFLYSIPNYSQSVNFNTNLLGGAKEKTASISFGDIDNDGDLDITSSSNDKLSLYKNNGAVNPSWTNVIIDSNVQGGRDTISADIDNDGDLDLILTDRNNTEVVYYKNNGDASTTFTKVDVSTSDS